MDVHREQHVDGAARTHCYYGITNHTRVPHFVNRRRASGDVLEVYCIWYD